MIKYIGVFLLPLGDTCIVLELVQGTSLSKAISNKVALGVVCAPVLEANEQAFKKVAVQLSQTVHYLHCSKVSHLDITSNKYDAAQG